MCFDAVIVILCNIEMVIVRVGDRGYAWIVLKKDQIFLLLLTSQERGAFSSPRFTSVSLKIFLK